MNDSSRQYPAARLTRMNEPYHFERWRSAIHSSYPRVAQPNTNQPNQIFNPLMGFGSVREYWDSVFRNYIKKGKAAASITNLGLGRF